MANRRRTGLDKQSSVVPIVLGAVAVAAVLGLIGGVVWGLASSSGKTAPPAPLPSQSSASASPTPTLTSASPTPTLTSASPTPTLTSASPTASASPTPTGIPAYPGHDITSSGTWTLSYKFDSSTGHLQIIAQVFNSGPAERTGNFKIYVYLAGKYLATLTAPPTSIPADTKGKSVTFTSTTAYAVGAKVIYFVATP